MFKTFKEWILARETSAFERSRKAAAQGLGPDIPDASINSRNTFTEVPGETKKFKKKFKKKKHGGGDSKKK